MASDAAAPPAKGTPARVRVPLTSVPSLRSEVPALAIVTARVAVCPAAAVSVRVPVDSSTETCAPAYDGFGIQDGSDDGSAVGAVALSVSIWPDRVPVRVVDPSGMCRAWVMKSYTGPDRVYVAAVAVLAAVLATWPAALADGSADSLEAVAGTGATSVPEGVTDSAESDVTTRPLPATVTVPAP